MIVRKDFSCLFFFVLVSCSVMGQVKQKKRLTPADYHLWSSMEISDISNKGKWVSYALVYQSGKDTLFVKSSDGKKTYSYPQGSKGKFCGERWFASKLENDVIKLTDLEKGNHKFFEGMLDYEFSGNGKYLFMISKPAKGISKITIVDLQHGTNSYIENVACWRFNDKRDSLAYCLLNGGAVIVAIGNKAEPVTTLQFTDAIGINMLWHDNNASLLFALKPLNNSGELDDLNTRLALYRFDEKKLFQLHPKEAEGFSKDRHIEAGDIGTLKISDDGKRIFFSEVPDVVNNPYKNPLVEVWQGDDKLLYSERQQYDPLDQWAKTAVWHPDTGAVFEFMPNETHVKLSGNQKYALTSSLEPCELQFRYSPDRDYYITNLITKERKLWLHCHSPELAHTLMSPSAKYIAYYKDNHWYSYDIGTGQHKNLTDGLGVAFYDEANDIGDKPDSYGFAGWTPNDESIIVHDRFDVWDISTDGTGARRLTKGREKNISYRITKPQNTEVPFNGIYTGNIIKLNSCLLLTASSADQSKQGYYILENGKEKPLVFGSHHIYGLKKAADAIAYIFLEEDYEHAPRLQFRKGHQVRTVYQSNRHQENYLRGKVTTITYMGATRKSIKGLLYYPVDYEKGKTYPMIVRVYQKQSGQLHLYRNPSHPVYDGFSIISLVSNGYFVLLPDIDYVMGNPAGSSVICTTEAVKSVLAMGDVDSKRVGLIGHSFGGYESAYIITKSNLFATAVAGAAFTDLLSEYLTISKNYKKAEFWRYEYYTNRMIKPLFENIEGYIRNSVVFNAGNIKTPLLLWTGEEDPHVASTQATELYLAMRRLGRKVTMLRYPKEGHTIENMNAQLDLSEKALEWFDYYLKGTPKKEWMGNN